MDPLAAADPPSKRLRKRKYTLNWRATVSGKRYPVTLTVPGPDDTCDILQDKITDASLGWVCPSIDYFVKADPQARKATLPCGHSFYATAIAYHARRNGLRCPVCRRGEDNVLNAQGIPKHLREHIVQHAQDDIAQEAQDELESAEQEAQRIQEELDEQDLFVFYPRVQMGGIRAVQVLVTAIPFNGGTVAIPPGEHFYTFPLRCAPGPDLEFHAARSHVRNLTRYLQSLEATDVHFRLHCDGVELCLTRPIALPLFLDGCQLNQGDHTNAVFTPHTSDETMSLSTNVYHYDTQDQVCVYHGRFFLRLSQPETTWRARFPVDTIRWAPDTTELMRSIVTMYTQ